MYTRHAQRRCQTRGLDSFFVGAILDHADVDRPIGSNCRLLRVSRKRARRLNVDDRLGRYAVIWSDNCQKIITVLPLHEGSVGARYRKKH